MEQIHGDKAFKIIIDLTGLLSMSKMFIYFELKYQEVKYTSGIEDEPCNIILKA